jgi:hypothetical protein
MLLPGWFRRSLAPWRTTNRPWRGCGEGPEQAEEHSAEGRISRYDGLMVAAPVCTLHMPAASVIWYDRTLALPTRLSEIGAWITAGLRS